VTRAAGWVDEMGRELPPHADLVAFAGQDDCERTVFRREGVCLTTRELSVGSRVYLRTSILGAYAIQKSPRLGLAIVVGVLSTGVAIPFAHARLSSGAMNLALVLLAVVAFTCITFVSWAQGSYCLVIVTAEGKHTALCCSDHQLVLFLAALLSDARGEPRSSAGIAAG